MHKNGNTDSDSNDRNKNNERSSPRAVWTIAAVGVVGVLVVGFVAIVLPNMAERTKFFTTNALSVLVLDVIIVQAYIYRRQWEAMQKQLRETRRMVAQGKLAVRAARRGVSIAQENRVYAHRAWLTVSDGRVDIQQTQVVFWLEIKNSGNTPANNVEVIAIAEFRERPPVPSLKDDFLSKHWIGTVGPGEPIGENITSPADASVVLDAIEQGLTRLEPYCWGIVKYRDIFNRDRQTRFCFTKAGIAWGPIQAYGPWNEAR